MPNLNDTRGILVNYFKTAWGSTTKIAYQNVPFDDTGLTEYVETKLIPLHDSNACIGSYDTKRKRHEGVLAIFIYTKQNSSAFRAYELADLVADYMDNKKIASNLTTSASINYDEGVRKDGWYSVNVRIPFTSDEQ